MTPHRQGPRGAILSYRLAERPPTAQPRWHTRRATDEDLLAMARVILKRARRGERLPIIAAIAELEAAVRRANGRRGGSAA